jgi:hypothetical protein
VEVVDPARHPDMTDPDLGLDRARPVDDADEPFVDRASVDDPAARGRPDRRPPAAQQPLDDAADIDPAQVAAHEERGPGRIDAALVRGPEACRRELCDRLLRPAGRQVVGRRPLVDRRGIRLVGSAARVGPGLEQVVQPLVAEALDLRLGERRVEATSASSSGRLEAGAGTSTLTLVASQPASAWSDAPRRSAASTRAIAP